MDKIIFEEKVEVFIKKLSNYETKTEIAYFNPWKDYDENNDKDKTAPAIRCKNLKNYLLEREKAKYILIGEAPSYNGCKFSGIPFMSERILLMEHDKIEFDNKGNKYKRTSDKNKRKTYCEPTATMIWETMNKLQKPNDWVAWNVFPFHPPKNGEPLSNRTPNDNEIRQFNELVQEFINLFNDKSLIIPVGKKAYVGLGLNEKSFVRHPANGGQKDFREGIEKIIQQRKKS